MISFQRIALVRVKLEALTNAQDRPPLPLTAVSDISRCSDRRDILVDLQKMLACLAVSSVHRITYGRIACECVSVSTGLPLLSSYWLQIEHHEQPCTPSSASGQASAL